MQIRDEFAYEETAGERGLVKEPIGFMTSARKVAERLDRKCDGGHAHVH